MVRVAGFLCLGIVASLSFWNCNHSDKPTAPDLTQVAAGDTAANGTTDTVPGQAEPCFDLPAKPAAPNVASVLSIDTIGVDSIQRAFGLIHLSQTVEQCQNGVLLTGQQKYPMQYHQSGCDLVAWYPESGPPDMCQAVQYKGKTADIQGLWTLSVDRFVRIPPAMRPTRCDSSDIDSIFQDTTSGPLGSLIEGYSRVLQVEPDKVIFTESGEYCFARAMALDFREIAARVFSFGAPPMILGQSDCHHVEVTLGHNGKTAVFQSTFNNGQGPVTFSFHPDSSCSTPLSMEYFFGPEQLDCSADLAPYLVPVDAYYSCIFSSTFFDDTSTAPIDTSTAVPPATPLVKQGQWLEDVLVDLAPKRRRYHAVASPR